MAPSTDIYIVTEDRSQTCIDKFLSNYACLTTAKTRDNFSVLVDGEGVETGTFVDTIDYGLAEAQRSFAVYFKSAVKGLESVILFFTPDGKLVFGLSIEYDPGSAEEAKRVLAKLKADFTASLGIITCETAPGDAYDWISENLKQI
jgi:hypothetical protein